MSVAASLVGGESYRARVLRDAPSAYWRLADAALASTIADSSGNGLAASVIGGVTFQQGGALSDGSPAALFDGTSGYGKLTNDATLNALVTTISVEAWVNSNTLTVPQTYRMIWCSRTNSYLVFAFGHLMAAFRIAGVQKAALAAATFAINTWYHVVGTYDGANVKTYVNGVLSATTAATGALSVTAGSPTFHAIGDYATAPATGYGWSGLIDDVAIYPIALTARQVAEHFALRSTVPSGLRLGGTAASQRKRTIAATGGVRISGTAPTTGSLRQRIAMVGTGGVRVSGAAVTTGRLLRRGAIVGAGGWRVGGSAVSHTTRGRSFSALPRVSQAIYAALNVPAVTDRAPGGVHDVVPQNTPYPFVLFDVSETRQLGGFGTKPGAGELPEIALRVHVFSQQANLSEAQAILAQAIARLTDPPPVLGYGSWGLFHDSTTDLGDQVVANVTVHEVVAQFRLYVEEGVAA